MTKTNKIVFGIDLGANYSCSGKTEFISGKYTCILSKAGEQIPSVVKVKEDGFEVGESAKLNSTSCIYESKRLLGKEFNDEDVQNDIKNGFYGFDLIKGDHDEIIIKFTYSKKVGRKRVVEFKEIKPYEVSSEILKYIKNTICNEFGIDNGNMDAVITVPANFNSKQIEEIIKAAKLVGINVINLLNEPTAAAIVYALYFDDDKLKEDGIILLFDLGGGTFDCTIMKINSNNGKPIYEVLTSIGNNHLGGVDIDDAIYKYVLNELKENYKDIYEEYFGDGKRNNNINKLKINAERAKIDFSIDRKGYCSLNGIYKDEDGSTIENEIPKELWDKTVKVIVNKCKELVNKALEESKLIASDLNQVIMIGGSCQIKDVSDTMEEMFGDDKIVNNKIVGRQHAVTIGVSIDAFVRANNMDVYSIEKKGSSK